MSPEFEAWWETKYTPEAFKDLAWSAWEAAFRAGELSKDAEWVKKLAESYARTSDQSNR